MKKFIPLIISILLLVVGIAIFLYSGLDQILLNLIFLNIIVYFIRTILIRIFNSLFKTRMTKYSLIKYALILIVDITWIAFIFALLFYFSPIFAISIISFLIVAISLTFRDIISNIASGIIILSSQMFEPGDLVSINKIEGIVSEITLNYTKIKEFDGVLTYIPNNDIYNASVVKYTHRELKIRKNLFKKQEELRDKSKVKEYTKKLKNIIVIEKKVTSYIKIIEILNSVNPNTLHEKFQKVFDKYESLFGIRPTYNVNNTLLDRTNISLRINSRDPNVIFENTDVFIRDILYELNYDDVFLDWDDYKKKQGIID